MKIAVISSNVFAVGAGGLPGYGGLEMIAWHCARGLAAKGHAVSLFAPQGSECPNVEIVSTGPPGQWGEKESYKRTWEQLPAFDAIIDHSWAKYAYIGKKEGVIKAPVLGVMHAPVNTMFGSPPPVPKPCIVCISEDQANHWRALHGNQDARACYNGVDTEFYRPITGLPRTRRFLFLARFSSIKGPLQAIEACKKAGVGLDLVGDTSITQEPELYRRCHELADGVQIRIVGPCTRGESVWWFSQAHCLLHPNQNFREPFGLAPVEAMACGCPVIAFDYGAMRETVPIEGGSLVKSMDEFHDVVEVYGKANLEPMRESSRKNAERFTIERMVNRYEGLCEEAIKSGGW